MRLVESPMCNCLPLLVFSSLLYILFVFVLFFGCKGLDSFY